MLLYSLNRPNIQAYEIWSFCAFWSTNPLSRSGDGSSREHWGFFICSWYHRTSGLVPDMCRPVPVAPDLEIVLYLILNFHTILYLFIFIPLKLFVSDHRTLQAPRAALESLTVFIVELLPLRHALAQLPLNLLKALRNPKAFLNVLCREIDFYK